MVLPADDSSIAYPTYNVLIINTMGGSVQKVLHGIGVDLSKTTWAAAPQVNMFNVSVFTEREPIKLKQKESDTFHLIEWTHKAEDIITPTGPHFPSFKKHENDLIDQIVRGGNQTFIQFI